MSNLEPVKFTHENPLIWEDKRDLWFARIEHASTLKIPHLPILAEHKGRCLVIGAAPSVEGKIKALRQLRGKHNLLISLNGAHNWLVERHLPPHIHILLEHDLETARESLGGEPHPYVTYYMSSVLKPEIFKEMESYKRVLFHTFYPIEEYLDYIAKRFPEEYCTCGGLTTLFKALAIGFFLGYRKYDLFGCDCSFLDSSHIDGYITADTEPVVHVYGKNADGDLKRFKTQGGLTYQVKELLEFCDARKKEIKMRVHGDGLLKYVHESRYPEWYQL